MNTDELNNKASCLQLRDDIKVKYPKVRFMVSPNNKFDGINLNTHQVIGRLAWITMINRLGDKHLLKGLIRSINHKPNQSDIRHAIKVTRKNELTVLCNLGMKSTPNVSCRNLWVVVSSKNAYASHIYAHELGHSDATYTALLNTIMRSYIINHWYKNSVVTNRIAYVVYGIPVLMNEASASLHGLVKLFRLNVSKQSLLEATKFYMRCWIKYAKQFIIGSPMNLM